MTTVHTLASGSSGNAAVLSCGDTHLLIDAGISCRRITAALKELGLTPADLTAILITHTHSDHISGLNTLLKKTTCPLLATPRTCRELSCRVEGIDPRLMGLDGPITLGEIDMQPIPTSHDAPGSCGWRLDTESGSVGFLTDTGYVTDEALDLLPGVDFVILESNHDVESLCSGPYPYYLKQRILGLQGHLCNEDAAQFAVTLAENGASDIVLAHLSRDNNTPAMALNAVAAALDGAGLTPELSGGSLPRPDRGGPLQGGRRCPGQAAQRLSGDRHVCGGAGALQRGAGPLSGGQRRPRRQPHRLSHRQLLRNARILEAASRSAAVYVPHDLSPPPAAGDAFGADLPGLPDQRRKQIP